MRVCSRHYETLDARACQTGFNLLFSQARLSFSVVIHEIALSAAQRPVTLPPYGNDATPGHERPFGAGGATFCFVMPPPFKRDRFSLQGKGPS